MMWILRLAMSMFIGAFIGRVTHRNKWPFWFGLTLAAFVATLANVTAISIFGL